GALDRERNRDLFADGIVPGPFGNGAEIGSQLAGERRILGIAEQHIVGRLVYFGEPAQQVSDVSADAEIMKLARVNGDSHPLIICQSRSNPYDSDGGRRAVGPAAPRRGAHLPAPWPSPYGQRRPSR